MKPVLQVFAGDFAAKVLLGLAGLALIRFMPAGEYAIFTLATVIAALIEQGLTGNFNRIYIVGHRELHFSAMPERTLTLQLTLLALLSLAAAPLALSAPLVAACTAAATAATCVLEFVKTYLQHRLRFVSFSLVEALRGLSFVAALAVLLPLVGENLKAWHVLALQALCTAAVAFPVFLWQLRLSGLLRFRAALGVGQQVLRSRYLYMMAYFFGVAMLIRVNVFMIELLDDELQLATYGSVLKYYAILMLLLGSMHTVLLPLTNQARRKQDLQLVFAKHRRMLLVLIPAVAAAVVAAPWLIPLIDGGKYPDAPSAFRVLAFSAGLSLTFSPYANLLLRYGEFRYLFVLSCGAIMLNVGLNAILIPELHATGAAWAFMLASGCVNVGPYLRARKLLADSPLPDQAAMPAGAARG